MLGTRVCLSHTSAQRMCPHLWAVRPELTTQLQCPPFAWQLLCTAGSACVTRTRWKRVCVVPAEQSTRLQHLCMCLHSSIVAVERAHPPCCACAHSSILAFESTLSLLNRSVVSCYVLPSYVLLCTAGRRLAHL